MLQHVDGFNKGKNILKNGKKTIAVLGGSLSSSYQEGIIKGASDAVIEKDFNLICFLGGPLNSPDLTSQSRESIFQLVDTNLVDGIIIPASSHLRYLNKEDTLAFIEKFSSVPLVNIGGYIEGVVNIVPDYEEVLSQLFEHLIDEHGYKRIALFRGPKNHASSEERMSIYLKLLKKYGIPIDSNLIIYGDLLRETAKYSVEEFFDLRNEKCDVIIAVNDNQALGIIDNLKERGCRVPQDIAVIGTMGIEEGIFSEPSLTTIREPSYELGRAAVFTLADILAGIKQPTVIKIPTDLIIRNSCGCIHEVVKSKQKDICINLVLFEDKNKFRSYIFNDTKKKCTDILVNYRCISNYNEIDNILIKFYYALIHGKYISFIDELRGILINRLRKTEILAWLEIISVLQYKLIQLQKINEDGYKILEFLEELLILKDDIQNKAIIFQSYKADYNISCFKELTSNLNASFDINAIAEYCVKIFDIKDCFISVYDNRDTENSEAVNVMIMRNKNIVNIDEKDKKFIAKSLLPQCIEAYNERYSLLVFPLSFRKEPLGFLILNQRNRKGINYENMQVSISAALKNELQIQKLKEEEEKIKSLAYFDILTGLSNRTMFQDKLINTIRISQENKNEFALMFLDIDKFKHINDTMGHDSGDLVLQKIAKILIDYIGEYGFISRFAGDEFTIILTEAKDRKKIGEILDKVFKKLISPINICGKDIFITMSVGIAMYPEDGVDSVSILKNADIAMYKAKDIDGNKYLFYDRNLS
ncbi:LacI family DNA-binding transcriptional regulator [Clostridium sp. DL1XJH146]